MGDPAADWPGEDARAIALAARVVLLTQASRTCSLSSPTEDERDLLSLIGLASDLRLVRGRSFSEFLDFTKRKVARDADDAGLDEVGPALEAIAAAVPADPIGELYAELVSLASAAYAPALVEPLDPALRRSVLDTEAHTREVAVRGGVRRFGNEVELIVHLPCFDASSLVLVPRILSHELICHVAASDVGHWPETPVPDVRTYFSEGFMDRAAWRLLASWVDGGELATAFPLDQLSGTELEAAADRPIVFKAGRRAFDNCMAKTTDEVKRRVAVCSTAHWAVRTQSEEASIRAALRMNTCRSDIASKDWFVHFARSDERGKAVGFGLFAADDGHDPMPLLEDAEDAPAAG
jgi:hypothetical protein